MLCTWATMMNAQQIYFVSPNGTGDGSTWGSACSLQYAVQHATSADEIWAMAGYYYGNLVIGTNMTIRGGFAGTENSLQDRAPLTSMDISTIFSTSQFSILDATDSNRSVVRVDCDRFVMDRFTLTGGNTNFGGGLVFENTGAWVVNNTIVCNSTNGQGSAISLDCAHPALHSTILWGNYVIGNPVGVTVYGHSQPCNITYYSCCINCVDNPFVNFQNDDYRLMPVVNNPCINTGMWPSGIPFNSITTDLDHNPRVSNGGESGNNNVDIGAYELQ